MSQTQTASLPDLTITHVMQVTALLWLTVFLMIRFHRSSFVCIILCRNQTTRFCGKNSFALISICSHNCHSTYRIPTSSYFSFEQLLISCSYSTLLVYLCLDGRLKAKVSQRSAHKTVLVLTELRKKWQKGKVEEVAHREVFSIFTH